jgi:hypothetical protein
MLFLLLKKQDIPFRRMKIIATKVAQLDVTLIKPK